MLFLVGLIANLVIGAPVAAVILRASISLANWILRRNDSQSQVKGDAVDETREDVTRDDPFAAPSLTTAQCDEVIPEPEFGKAYAICLLQAILGLFINYLLGLYVAQLDDGVAVWPALTFGFILTSLINAGTLVMMLPTSFRRVLLIMLCQLLIGIAVGAVILGIVSAVGLVT